MIDAVNALKDEDSENDDEEGRGNTRITLKMLFDSGFIKTGQRFLYTRNGLQWH
jgi:hypothetical protein